MNQRFRPLTCLFALAMLTAFSSDAVAAARHKQTQHAKKADAGHKRHAAQKTHKKSSMAAVRRKSAKSTDTTDTLAPAATAAPLTGDLAVVRQAIDLARKGKTGEATAIGKTIGDPAAQRLCRMVCSCATPTGRRILPLLRPSLPITRTGRARACSAGGRKGGCGRSEATRDGSPLHRWSADERQGQVCARARPACRRRS
jgi:hypothetical protein